MSMEIRPVSPNWVFDEKVVDTSISEAGPEASQQRMNETPVDSSVPAPQELPPQLILMRLSPRAIRKSEEDRIEDPVEPAPPPKPARPMDLSTPASPNKKKWVCSDWLIFSCCNFGKKFKSQD